MNPWPTLQQWLEFGGIVSLEMLLLFAVAKLISLRLRPAQGRRCLWQIVMLGVLLVFAGELSGVREMVRLPQPLPEKETTALPTKRVVVTIKDAELPLTSMELPFEPTPIESIEAPSRVSPWQQPTIWPAVLWLGVSSLLLGRILLGQTFSLFYRLPGRRNTDAELNRRVARIAELLLIRRRLTVARSSGTVAPFTFGAWRPVIVLPARFTEVFTSGQQDAAIAHELAHVAGLDSAWRGLSNFTCALLWWNPFAWLVRRELDHASELVADESSLLLREGPDRLAECLVACANQMQRPTAAAWLGMDGGGFRSSLGKRVARLLQLNPRASASVRVPWHLRIVLPLICTFAVWHAMDLVPGETETRSQHPWRDSLIGNALAALAEPQKPAVPEVPGESVRIEVARLVQDGKLYYETGRLTEAEKSLSAARKLDPENQAAAYYLDLLRARQSAAAQGEVEQQWTEPVPKRQRLLEKIRRIRLPEFGPYEDAPLPEVVRELADRARSLDPEREGIKLFLNPNADGGTGHAVDTAGPPVKPPTDLSATRIRLRNPLKDLTLEQVMIILVEIADRKIHYSVEDYGVIISPKATEPNPLHTRFFKLDPNTFQQGLRSMIGSDSNTVVDTNYVIKNPRLYDSRPSARELLSKNRPSIIELTPAETVIPKMKSFLKKAGVDLSAPGKAIFYSDRRDMLMVRATLQDLDTVEKALQMLNMSRPQLEIRVKVMVVPANHARDALLLFGLTNSIRSAGTFSDPSLLSVTNFPKSAERPIAARPAPTVSGILTDEQFRQLIAKMEKSGGTDLLSAPTVITMSGRQAQIKVVDVRYVVTDIDYSTNGLPAGSPPEPRPIAEPFEIGPVVDIVPYVEADGYTIQMTVLPTLREFLGYDEDPIDRRNDLPATGGPFAPTPRTVTPLPKFRLRQIASTGRVWDGQTLVLGAGQARTLEKIQGPDGTVTTNHVDKELFFFITPRLIDSAGNPLHSDDELRQLPGVPQPLKPAPKNEYE